VYYTAFAYPVELARDDESDNTPFPVDEQLAVASAATRVTVRCPLPLPINVHSIHQRQQPRPALSEQQLPELQPSPRLP